MIFSVQQLEIFLLVFARIAGVFIQAPVFSSRSFPSSAKTAFAVWLTIVLWFVTPASPDLPNSMLGFLVLLAAEAAFGFLIGFVCNIIFLALQSAGEIIDLQMGLSVASALDPVFGAVISVIGRLSFFFALIVFLAMDGHHLILTAFQQSFSYIPAGKMANFSSPGLVIQLMELSSLLWTIAIKIAAPVVLLIFLSDFTFGIVSRVAPQVNVFMLGFQVKPMLGLFGIIATLPFIVRYLEKLIEDIGQEMVRLFTVLK